MNLLAHEEFDVGEFLAVDRKRTAVGAPFCPRGMVLLLALVASPGSEVDASFRAPIGGALPQQGRGLPRGAAPDSYTVYVSGLGLEPCRLGDGKPISESRQVLEVVGDTGLEPVTSTV